MTEPTPTDAEINALAEPYLIRMFSSRIVFNGTMIDFARAVLAKWGTPPAVAVGEPVDRVFIVATGEEHEGEATYTRYDHAPPPLCDSECLYTAPQPAVAAQGDALEPDSRERWDAELGRTAMLFVDRAGDPHPGIDDAETICAEFYAAMSAVIERMPHVKRMNAAIDAARARSRRDKRGPIPDFEDQERSGE